MPDCSPDPSSRTPCRHCKTNKAQPGKLGMCNRCYRNQAVRALYESEAPTGRRGTSGENRSRRPLPPEPTDAPPGSDEKIEVLRERAKKGQALWHPGDAPMGPEIDRPASRAA